MTATPAPLSLRKLQRSLQSVADGLVVDINDAEVQTDELVDHLRCLRIVFDATDAGNTKAAKAPGPLREHRTALYHALADRGVTRAEIAAAAGVSENAIGFAFRGSRRRRRAEQAPEPDATEPDPPTRKRRPRPDAATT
jgi:hypothetical protein